MKKSLKAVVIGLSILNCSVLFSETLDEKSIIPSNAYNALVKKGNFRIIHETADNDYVLLPEFEFKKDCELDRVLKKEKYFPFIAETIYKINKADIKKASDSPKDSFNIIDVSKIFRSISKMQGMTYYSTTRKKRTVLYEKAYMIESAENPVAVKDKTEDDAEGKILYAFLEDVSFGPCRYRLAYRESENTLYARFTNLDTMGLGPIKAVYPKDLIINIIVIDCGDSFVVYLGTDVDCIKFPGIKGKLEDSLVSRLDAIYDWFIKQF